MKTCTKCNILQTNDAFYINCSSCKLCKKKYQSEYRRKNKNKVYAYNTKWNKANPEKYKNIKKKWNNALENKGYRRHKCAERRSKLKKATFDMYKKDIIKIYDNCPKGHHVDHIVPLNGINVSGLHVPWNLQYLPAKENMLKGNR